MATIKDVARQADVSLATVSHVINQTRFVSDELRTRVVTAMQELNYSPNSAARSLRSGETRTIGLIVPDNSNPFFAEIARIIEDIGFDNGYSVIFCNSDGNNQKESSYIQLLISKRVDGVIFIASQGTSGSIRDLTEQKIPIVIADREIPQPDVDVVLVNNEQGGYLAAQYLLSLGHRRIGCICGPSRLTPLSLRLRGYQKALKENGIPYREELVVPGDLRFQGGERGMRKLLELSERPTAVFALNDLMAIGAIRAIRKAGLRIPEDVSLVGFDNIPISTAIYPALTTVAQPIAKLAKTIAHLLIERIQKTHEVCPARQITLEPHLVIRDSCALLS